MSFRAQVKYLFLIQLYNRYMYIEPGRALAGGFDSEQNKTIPAIEFKRFIANTDT